MMKRNDKEKRKTPNLFAEASTYNTLFSIRYLCVTFI